MFRLYTTYNYQLILFQINLNNLNLCAIDFITERRTFERNTWNNEVFARI